MLIPDMYLNQNQLKDTQHFLLKQLLGYNSVLKYTLPIHHHYSTILRSSKLTIELPRNVNFQKQSRARVEYTHTNQNPPQTTKFYRT